jgi:bifunctional UDP-N-acetylglucosamine pyrophosphorylase / glucosamine-1-phosphate N-acetyltransferase
LKSDGMSELHIIVLAAGGGTRMKSAIPKVLQRVAGKPMLGHVLHSARALGPKGIHVVYGHKGELVRGAFATDPDLNWIEQSNPKGTGQAVQLGMRDIPSGAKVLVLFGDAPLITQATMARLVQAAAPFSALLSKVEDPASLGRVELSADQRIQAIVEAKDCTPAQLQVNVVNTGALVCESELLRAWLARLSNDNAQKEYYLTQIFEFAAREGQGALSVLTADAMEGFGANDAFELAQLERYFQARTIKQLMQMSGLRVADPARLDLRVTSLAVAEDVELDVNVILEGAVQLGTGVRIGAFTRIKDCDLAPGTVVLSHCDLDGVRTTGACKIGPFARLRPGTELAEGAQIGNFVETKKARIGRGSKASHLTYLGDSTLGERVNIGAGTITCNYDGVNKFETLIEDDVFVGSNSSLVAPVLLERGATIGAGSVITRSAPAEQLTLRRAKQVSVAAWKRPSKKGS